MPRKSTKQEDAIAMLKADHEKVKKMFKTFEKLKEDDEEEKARLVREACQELKVHTQLEEEIFYPAVRDIIDDGELMDEAEVEHDAAKQLISELEHAQPGEEKYDARFIVLGEYVNHHITEEQKEIFPKVKKAHLDLAELGARMAARKSELMQQQ